ncbi:MAG: Fur family transcriptional regulator [Candidatus Sericytochromatia bacterium]|nr:Fur family transcriptional regulator [Candidatus Sericytochromatia bacterium]
MSTKSDMHTVQESLRQRGYRLTSQRETILQLFQELPEGTHLSAEELHMRLRDHANGISLATTYRTIKLLASLGLLRELDFAEGHKHYEIATTEEAPHHHLVCVSCSQAIEFEEASLLELGQAVANGHRFHLRDVQLKVFGLCPECQTEGQKR